MMKSDLIDIFRGQGKTLVLLKAGLCTVPVAVAVLFMVLSTRCQSLRYSEQNTLEESPQPQESSPQPIPTEIISPEPNESDMEGAREALRRLRRQNHLRVR